jgi:hypothetical protein
VTGKRLKMRAITVALGLQFFIVPVVESQLGDRLSLDGLSEWGDAKAVMDYG